MLFPEVPVNGSFALDDLLLLVILVEGKLAEADAVQDSAPAVECRHEDHQEEQGWEDPLIEAFTKEAYLDQGTHDLEKSTLLHSAQL